MGSGKLVFDGRPGAETIAHIRENGRVTVLFNAFDGPPRILRLYGKGQSFSTLLSGHHTYSTPPQAPSTRLAVRNMNSSFPHPSANPVHEPSSSSTSSKLALCASPYPALFFCSSLQVSDVRMGSPILRLPISSLPAHRLGSQERARGSHLWW